ncbi:MAG: acyl-CoA dehydrogenase family protein [Myxococcota bacterium]
MDFELTEVQAELVGAVHKVLERECPPALARAVVEEGRTPEQPWKSARELGWTAISIDESHGGLGLGFEELGLVVEEHGRFLAPGPLLATLTQLLPVLRELGSKEQRAEWLPRIAAGELTGTLAWSGATGRGLGPLPDASLRARRDGAGYRLDGSRHFVLDGDTADEIAVAARVDEGDGCALFCVPRGALRSERITALDASRPLATLHFEGLQVGPERTLGEPGSSAVAFQRALDETTVALALDLIGACGTLLDLSLEHARHRHQFGQPIGAFQAIQHKCADCLVALEKARATAYFAMMTIAERDPRSTLAASMAKAAAGAAQRRICREAIQIHGGTGYTWESDVHLFVKRAQSNAALFGTAAEHRDRIADVLKL